MISTKEYKERTDSNIPIGRNEAVRITILLLQYLLDRDKRTAKEGRRKGRRGRGGGGGIRRGGGIGIRGEGRDGGGGERGWVGDIGRK